MYEKADAAPVTVTYVDADGNELATPDQLNGKIGDPYETSAKSIAGWTVTTTPNNASGTFGEEAQTVTYVYHKNKSIASGKVIESNIKNDNQSGNHKNLPKTGEVSSLIGSVIGTLLLVGTGVLFLIKRKAKK